MNRLLALALHVYQPKTVSPGFIHSSGKVQGTLNFHRGSTNDLLDHKNIQMRYCVDRRRPPLLSQLRHGCAVIGLARDGGGSKRTFMNNKRYFSGTSPQAMPIAEQTSRKVREQPPVLRLLAIRHLSDAPIETRLNIFPSSGLRTS